MLLGVEYLAKHNTDISFKDHTLRVQGIKVPITNKDQGDQTIIYTKEELTIPPMSAARVRYAVDVPIKGQLLVSPWNNKELLTPWTVCRDQNNLHVLLCNCTN